MKRFYVIYLSQRADDTVSFSKAYPSFNSAKDNIDSFLNEFANKRGKKIVTVSKEDLEKLKINKNPEDNIFVRRKNSEAVLYLRNTLTGTFYNSYIIEKCAKIGISEFSYSFNVTSNNTNVSEEEIDDVKISEIIEKKIEGVEKKTHGAHVNLISELKSVLLKKERKEIKIEDKVDIKGDSEFVKSLVAGQLKLRHITPPAPRKFIL